MKGEEILKIYIPWILFFQSSVNPYQRRQNTQTPTGTARAEDPARKSTWFSEEAEAVPVESEVFCRSGDITVSTRKNGRKQILYKVTSQFMFNVRNYIFSYLVKKKRLSLKKR
ncbi:hypothetical protein SAMN04487943_109136 [Gracilibacillus orientalis]|uniref:Uncharacterized protein n=1 Tax=Gracilibacillus orientalis TaxID=334253 RepID=A0A1I4NTI3_9BACI|nr:hypothetical protein SAMN04487943_109136 [Gracilibacillus orientalis]